jgi:hypothetical protein
MGGGEDLPVGKGGLFTMLPRREELAGYQLVGAVMAHQGSDG